MREWAGKFFKENSIKYYTWWTDNKTEGLGKRGAEKADFDLVCELKQQSPGCSTFTGQDKQVWTLKSPMKTGKFVVLNGVKQQGQVLQTTSHWGYLSLQHDCYDAKHFASKCKPTSKPAGKKSQSKSTAPKKKSSTQKKTDEVFKIVSVGMIGKTIVKRHCEKCNRTETDLKIMKCCKCKGKIPLIYSVTMSIEARDSGLKQTIFVVGSHQHNPFQSLKAPSLNDEKSWSTMTTKKLKELTDKIMKLKGSTKTMKFTTKQISNNKSRNLLVSME